MGIYDIPAVMNYITKTTNTSKLTIIAHSQGTTEVFAGMSILPEIYTKYLNGFIALGPVTNLNYINTTFVKTIADYKIDKFFNLFNMNELFPSPDSVHKISTFICEKLTILCNGLMNMLANSNINGDDQERFLVFVSHFPSGASLKSISHFAEIIRRKKFINLNTNKEYDLNVIKGVEVAMFVGAKDRLATYDDNRNLRNIFLKNNVLHFYKEYENMGHSTFFLNKSNEYVSDVIRCVNDFNI
jgi:hypothetical protein